MRWFKHFSDNHRGQTVQTLMNDHGHAGVAAYYIIMELCAEKFEPIVQKKGDPLSEHSDFVFTFKRPYFDNVLRMKRKRSENVLRTLSESGVLIAEVTQNEVKIEMPILAKLLDRDMKKPRLKRESNAQKPRLDKDLDLDKDKDLDKEGNRCEVVALNSEKQKTKKDQEPLRMKAHAFIASYCSLFKERWLVNPQLTGKDAGIAKRLSKDLSEMRLNELLAAYFAMPDAGVAKAKHPLNLFELKLNEIGVFAQTGKFTTRTEAFQADKFANNQILLNEVLAEAL
jgi:hypothetical protein